jgi:hypothetical protein
MTGKGDQRLCQNIGHHHICLGLRNVLWQITVESVFRDLVATEVVYGRDQCLRVIVDGNNPFRSQEQCCDPQNAGAATIIDDGFSLKVLAVEPLQTEESGRGECLSQTPVPDRESD